MKPTRRSGWARPARIRLSFSDEPAGSLSLPLPRRRMWPAGLVTGAMFAVFAWVAVGQMESMLSGSTDTVFSVVVVLFQGFWVLGWSVGVLILFLLTVLFLFYRESAYVTGNRLVHAPRLGPIRIRLEYELAKIQDLEVGRSRGGDHARVRFRYRGKQVALGSDMPGAQAESNVRTIRAAIERYGGRELELGVEASEVAESPAAADAPSTPEAPAQAPPQAPSPASPSARHPITAPSSLALIGANLVPLLGVVVLRWDLGQVMVLFWTENAVIGFYTLLKLVVVGRWAAVFVAPFFVGHYGGFMAGHFLFIYYLFVRGMDASGPEASAGTALGELFVPLWPALLALFVSHGVSFYTNFLRRREHAGLTVHRQMAEPYKRIIMLHLTIILGGWGALLLHSAVPALVLLVALKTAMDLWAHRREHSRPSS